jgi:hypothetical protein
LIFKHKLGEFFFFQNVEKLPNFVVSRVRYFLKSCNCSVLLKIEEKFFFLLDDDDEDSNLHQTVKLKKFLDLEPWYPQKHKMPPSLDNGVFPNLQRQKCVPI